MNKSTKKVLLGTAAVAALGLASQEAGAATTNVNISAIVLAPIQVTQTRTLNFGSLTEGGIGTLKVAVDDTPTAGGGVTSIGGTIQAGGFKIQGSAGAAVTVTAPTKATITETVGGVATMTVNAFNLAEPGPAGTTAGTLTDTSLAAASVAGYRIGGTLNVGAGQTTGTYTGTVTVTANYQ